MSNEKVAEVLERAAETLEQNEWITGELYDSFEGILRMCSVGAINYVLAEGDMSLFWDIEYNDDAGDLNEVSGKVAELQALRTEVCQALVKVVNPDYCLADVHPLNGVVSWNDGFDESERAKQLVLDGFHKAAKVALGVTE